MDIRAKLILALGAVILMMLGGMGLYHWGENVGTEKERGVWNGKEVLRKDAVLALTLKHATEMDELVAKHKKAEKETSDEHENELAKLRKERAADRADADRRGGLRIPAPACTGADKPVVGAETTSAIRRDEVPAGTVRIPQPIEDGLWSIVNDADEIVEQARSCQAWIRKNGFYGEIGETPIVTGEK